MKFISIDANAPEIFGFSEFLASLALMVLVWTIADIRYRFRVMTTPLPLQNITFGVIATVGLLTLLTDLWRAEQWFVPAGNLLTPAIWQALLGGVFLLTFLSWTWFAFIRPPIYSKLNSMRYARTLYRFILKGDPKELSVIADELTYSIKALVLYAIENGNLKYSNLHKDEGKKEKEAPKVMAIANEIMLLIADKRFCRAIVDSSPGTVLTLFREVDETKKYGIPIGIFSKNIVNEAFRNKNSFVYYETEGYKSGLIGYQKPLIQAMFSNYKMVEDIGTLFDLDICENWDSDQWKAYCQVVLKTFHNYTDNDFRNHSIVLCRALKNIEYSVVDLYKINGLSNAAWDNDIHQKLRVVIEFIKEAIDILEKKGVPRHVKLRIRQNNSGFKTFYDHIANMISEIIFRASAVQTPLDLCWSVQHNSVWGELFSFNNTNEPARKIVTFKVRRIVYNEIIDMKRCPNFKGAKILGFCLNVMGIKVSENNYDKDSKALQKVVLSWVKKNYAWLHNYNPRVAEDCLVDGLTYDSVSFRLIKTYPIEGLRRKTECIYFQVDHPEVEKEVSCPE